MNEDDGRTLERFAPVHTGIDLSAATATARMFAEASLSSRTQAAYSADWDRFVGWCERSGRRALPADPGDVVEYIAEHAALEVDGRPVYSPATIGRWVSSINAAHSRAGFTAPGSQPPVKIVLAGIRRVLGAKRPTRRMHPLMRDDLASVLETTRDHTFPAGVHAARDACLLLFAFAGAFRRDELSTLPLTGVKIHPDDGLHIRLRRSKTDQEAHGAIKALPYGQRPLTCAPCAFVRWTHILAASGDRAAVMAAVFEFDGVSGHVCRSHRLDVRDLPAVPLFPVVHRAGGVQATAMSGHAINLVVKRRVAAVGLDPAEFGGHSPRSGFVTQAVRAGASPLEVMRQTGHTNPATVAIYSRDNDPLAGNAVTRLGL